MRASASAASIAHASSRVFGLAYSNAAAFMRQPFFSARPRASEDPTLAHGLPLARE
jgi:hypothetical protein